MTQGIWKSVWLRTVRGAAIDMVAPQVTGTVDAKAPDTTNSFEVEVRVFVVAAAPGAATVRVAGSWSAGATASEQVRGSDWKLKNCRGICEIILLDPHESS
jgi:hypothetical protein